LPFEKALLPLPALGKGVGDSHCQVGVDEQLREEGVVSRPERQGVCFVINRLGDGFHNGCEVDPVALQLLVQLDGAGPEVVDGQGHCCRNSGREQ